MPPRPIRRKNQSNKDTALFAIVLLIGVAGLGYLAAYENGYLASREPELQPDDRKADDQSAAGTSPDATRQASGLSSHAESYEGESDPLSRPTLVTRTASNEAVYDSLSASQRESLQHIADAVDTTLKGRHYRGQLTVSDLQTAERYGTLINQVRWREFWFRTAARTAGFPKFQRLRDRGDIDDFKSAAVAWAQLDGFTRGIVLEALQAIEDGDEDLRNAHRGTIEQYPFILGLEIPGTEQPEQPLRAPHPD